MIWSANADFIQHTDETDLILSKINHETYKTTKKEFHRDNDQQSIDKICESLERLDYSKGEINQVFEDMKELFMADGDFSSLEDNLSRGLKQILG